MATTRNRKTATAAAAAQTINVEVDKPLSARVDEFMTKHLATPELSWQRNCVALGAGLLASMGLGWLIGEVTGVLMVMALITSGSMVLPVVLFIVALVAAYHYGNVVGNWVYRMTVGALK